ncbi:hypothetical protein JVT61DRAFT_11364 [Boletus reticuloceps]|uniref:Uncharacterized protein n=1 Tax=Boletus reticuloceps TaxID=495285 RepID=A0A8I3A3N8_9AGAM|nr:hypothetical protein JVT61DRAFT_11364 [Boletus reticuloceps]
MKSLYLAHPWLDALLEQEDLHNGAFVEGDVAPPTSPNTSDDAENSDEGLNDNNSSLLTELKIL